VRKREGENEKRGRGRENEKRGRGRENEKEGEREMQNIVALFYF